MLALGGLALGQQQRGSGTPTTPAAGAERRADAPMTAAHCAAMLKNAKHTLAEGIAAAEKHCGGRAVRAECMMKAGAGEGPVCVVTLLVGEDRLVEATVDSKTGKVMNQRDLDGPSQGRADRSKDHWDDFAMARSWQKSSNLTGKKVTNPADEDLGTLQEIVVDANSGRILYGVLSFGGFLGLGDKLFAIPWSALPLSGDAHAFVLDVDKERLEKAVTFDKRQWPNFADEQFALATFKHYNQKPYWQNEDGDVRQASDVDRRQANAYRARWNQRATVWQKASDLASKNVRNRQNDDLGKIVDLAIDPQAGRILYAILATRGMHFAIPWQALSLSADYKHFILDINKDQLTDALGFSKDNWPNMVDSRWATETHTYFKVEPYWTDARSEHSTATP
ncbi:MAG: PRC-barrel domain-containing protein [Phycisphaerales bacterium]|nr:PRC-barrel domain-containing protein [Phycisphaerales bacterium]